MKTGLIHLYIGEGKGKTTAAAGLAARAAGRGKRVVFGQLLKGRKTGEVASLEALGVTVIRSEKEQGFVWEMSEERKAAYKADQVRLFNEIIEIAFGDAELDLLVLDEALAAEELGFLDSEIFRDVLERKPGTLEIVCTGRVAPDWLLEKADYVTEMKKVKHPYDRGVRAREAIEY